MGWAKTVPELRGWCGYSRRSLLWQEAEVLVFFATRRQIIESIRVIFGPVNKLMLSVTTYCFKGFMVFAAVHSVRPGLVGRESHSSSSIRFFEIFFLSASGIRATDNSILPGPTRVGLGFCEEV